MRRLAWVLFIAAALLVLRGSPRAPMSEVLQSEGRKPALSAFEGDDLVEEPLTEREAPLSRLRHSRMVRPVVRL